MPWLITPAQLSKHIKNTDKYILLDASWHLPAAKRDAYAEYQEQHIPGAMFLNLNDFHDETTSLPNMLIQDEHVIREKLSSLGITREHHLIFYDHSEVHSSCRAAWMFKVFGHPASQLSILDGGFNAWDRDIGVFVNDVSKPRSSKPYELNYLADQIRTLKQMKLNLHQPQEQVIDMRHPVRYMGGGEPSVNLRTGHIPGSYSFPYMTMFDSTGKFKSLERIRHQLSCIGVSFDVPIITTCGSGMTAAILNVVLDLLNIENHALYDGSWHEWGSLVLYPGEKSIDERPINTSLENHN